MAKFKASGASFAPPSQKQIAPAAVSPASHPALKAAMAARKPGALMAKRANAPLQSGKGMRNLPNAVKVRMPGSVKPNAIRGA